MEKIVECIPNFSEGQDEDVVAKIVAAIEAVDGVILLGAESDSSHNRSVVSFAGEPEAVLEAAFRACKKAAELIDLEKHRGAHPRMGATDVIPFVPIRGVSMEDCVKLAEALSERIGRELDIPVYLYEKAAKSEARRNLADVRRGEYEGIRDEIGRIEERKPDFGPEILGSAGAVAVGAREALIAFNVNLKTNDLKVAKAIAKRVREKDGGLPFVKALGFAIEDKGIVQVSMNLTNYKVTPPHRVFAEIERLCAEFGVEVLESEVVGLIPQDALFEGGKAAMKIGADFEEEQILEVALERKRKKDGSPSLKGFLAELSAKSPTPGGGSVAALAGSLAAGLLAMVGNLTLGGKKYQAVHEEMVRVVGDAVRLRDELYELIAEDAEAYNKVVRAYKTKESAEIRKALEYAADVPRRTEETAAKLLPLLKVLKEKGNPNASSDCGVSEYLIEAAMKGARLNVEINLKALAELV